MDYPLLPKKQLLKGLTFTAIIAGAIGFKANAQSAADDWTMGFHDSRHSSQTSEILTPPLTLAWKWTDTLSADKSGSIMIWFPLFYRGNLIVRGGNASERLFSLNPSDASTNWCLCNGGWPYQYDNYPTAVAGRIVAGRIDNVYSFDAKTGGDIVPMGGGQGAYPAGGSANWKNRAYTHSVSSDVWVVNFSNNEEDMVLYADSIPYGYNATHGWASVSMTSQYGNNMGSANYGMRVPAVDSGIVYANYMGRLVSWDAMTGVKLWSWGSTINYRSSPAVMNGIIYFFDDSLHQLNALSAGCQGKKVIWTASIPGAFAPIVSDGVVYVGSSNGTFYALDALTGTQRWTFPNVYPYREYQVPAISGDLIYLSNNITLYALNKNTGAKVWQYAGTARWGPIAIGGGKLFTSTFDSKKTLYAFDATSVSYGPAVMENSIDRITNDKVNSIDLTGSGFFGGGSSSAVTGIHLDDAANTALSGYTVVNDQKITGVQIPSGIAPGTYHIKVQTTIDKTVNEPSLYIEAGASYFVSTLGITTASYTYGTMESFQRHIARTSKGVLIAMYIGIDYYQSQDAMYNISRDGGRTWSAQTYEREWSTQNFIQSGGAGSCCFDYAPTHSIWLDAQDHLNFTFLPMYQNLPALERFSLMDNDILKADSLFPVDSMTTDTALFPGPIVSESGGRMWTAYSMNAQLIGCCTHYVNVRAAYSDDAGRHWTQTPLINTATASQPTLVMYQDKPLVIYNDGGTLSWSGWNGSTWSTAQALPGSITGAKNLSAVVNNNTIHLVFESSSEINYMNYNGSVWSTAQVLDAAGTYPALTTNGSKLWCFYINASNDLVYRFTNAGTWSTTTFAITNDGNQNQAPATMELSPDAHIPVLWTANVTSCSGTSVVVKSALVDTAGNTTTGIRRVDESTSQISVYPNPANDKLFVTTDKNTQVKEFVLIDLTGRSVLSQNVLCQGCSNFTVDISKINPGVYFAQTKSMDGKMSTKKIVISR